MLRAYCWMLHAALIAECFLLVLELVTGSNQSIPS